jgi:hypothetical protein
MSVQDIHLLLCSFTLRLEVLCVGWASWLVFPPMAAPQP